MATTRRNGATERRNREPEILEAAIRVFHERGYRSASLQEVADIVGVLKGSLYHYISSKEQLLFRIMSESHVQADRIMRSAEESSDDPLEQLRHYLSEMTLWYLQNIDRVTIYFNEGRWLTGDRLEEVRRDRREFDSFLRSLIEKARDQHRVRPDVDARLAGQLILGALNSVSSWYRPDGLYSPQEIAQMLTDLMLASVAGAVPQPATQAESAT